MTIKIERGRKKTTRKKKKRSGLGFTNWLALLIMAFLFAGLMGGFYLAVKSIEYQYMGALACYTVVMTPIGTAASIVLKGIVHKSEGIKYAAAKAAGFVNDEFEDSPAI